MTEQTPMQRGKDLSKIAYSLAEKLQAREIPSDFDPEGWHYLEAVAHVRHTFTNYEDLLEELPDCLDCFGEDGECIHKAVAHDILKVEAKSLAMQIYDQWIEQHENKIAPSGASGETG